MGVFKKRTKKGVKYGIQYFENGQRVRKVIGPSKRDAEIALGRIKHRKVEGLLGISTPSCMKFDEFKERYLEWFRQNKKSIERENRLLNNLSVHFGSMEMEKISIIDVENYKARRLSGQLRFGKKGQRAILASPSTINREVGCLRRTLNKAVEMECISRNPIAGKITMLKEPEGRVRFLEPKEANLLIEQCAEHLKPIVTLALHTGMRKSEILNLTWKEVDLKREVILLPGTRTKNSRSRPVPMDDKAKEVLETLENEKLAGCDLVFHKPDGRGLGDFKKAFNAACRRAGIKDFHFHDLRHCCASAMAMRGVSLQWIGEVLGHKSMKMTQRYSHLTPQVLKAAVRQAGMYFDGEDDNEKVVRLARDKKEDATDAASPARSSSEAAKLSKKKG